MQLCIEHEFVVKTTNGYACSINGKVECPHQTIKYIVCIQLLSCGHHDDLFYFCYQYTI